MISRNSIADCCDLNVHRLAACVHDKTGDDFDISDFQFGLYDLKNMRFIGLKRMF